MRVPSVFIAAMAIPFLASTAIAHDFRVDDISVGHPYSFPTPGVAPSAIGYLTITNAGVEADTLIAVESPFETVTLHRTEIDMDGVARMLTEEGGIVIEPGQTVVMEPGGGHLMFEGLGGDALEEGEKVEVTLVFEHAGRLDVVFNVQARGQGTGETDHSMHGMDGAAMDHDMPGMNADQDDAKMEGPEYSGNARDGATIDEEDGATSMHVNQSGH